MLFINRIGILSDVSVFGGISGNLFDDSDSMCVVLVFCIWVFMIWVGGVLCWCLLILVVNSVVFCLLFFVVKVRWVGKMVLVWNCVVIFVFFGFILV